MQMTTTVYQRASRLVRGAALGLVASAAMLAGCADLNVPDYNNPSLEDLQTNPTRTSVNTAATGLLIGARANIAGPNAYVSLLGILGRESYNFDGSEPRFVTEMLIGPELSPSGAFGGNLWTLRYRNIRMGTLVLNAVDQVSAFTPAEKEGIRGFAKTIMALDYLLIINTRDLNGAVVDAARPLDDPGPLVGRDAVLAHVSTLLDEARGHLQAAGGSFAFPLSPGFSNFNTPATFLEFNRALKARTEVYRASYSPANRGTHYQAALSALSNSFVSTAAPLSLGAYHSYNTGSGETPNGLVAVTLYAHPSIVQQAQRQPGGALDQRVQSKVTEADRPGSQQGVSSGLKFTVYQSTNSPVPIIRNEELILLRAEARWFTGNKLGAIQDLNFIRQQAGGLAPTGLTVLSPDEAFVTELLRERVYSLLFEGGHRWLDARRFNRLESLPKQQGHVIHPRFPVPEAECLARGVSGDCSA